MRLGAPECDQAQSIASSFLPVSSRTAGSDPWKCAADPVLIAFPMAKQQMDPSVEATVLGARRAAAEQPLGGPATQHSLGLPNDIPGALASSAASAGSNLLQAAGTAAGAAKDAASAALVEGGADASGGRSHS